MNSISIYVHIPFCLYKCNYCDFYSIGIKNYKLNKKNKFFYNLNNKDIFDLYINSLIREINFYSIFFSEYEVRTIYFGGGTPSILKASFIDKIISTIFKKFKISDKEEITIEVNPEDLTEEKLLNYKNLGFNRISLGIQSFNDNDLKFLERRGNSYKNIIAIQYALKYFKNISCDLIAGLPDSSIINNLNILKKYRVPHISVYMLTIYNNLKLYSGIKNEIDKIEQKCVNDYLRTLKWIKNNGYEQYEISNFAIKEEFFSKHNMVYWERKPYIGFGPTASGFFDNLRYKNGKFGNYLKLYNKQMKDNSHNLKCGFTSYNFNVFDKNFCKKIKIKNRLINFYNSNEQYFSNLEILSKDEIEEEYIMLSLRLNKGLSFKNYKKIFRKDFIKSRAIILNELLKTNKVFIIDEYLRLNPQYFIFFNDIVSQLI